MIKEFHVTNTALVDGQLWYTIIAGKEASAWLRQQDNIYWHQHSKITLNLIDVSEDLLIIMKLKWPV
jgi:hypothetical protein